MNNVMGWYLLAKAILKDLQALARGKALEHAQEKIDQAPRYVAGTEIVCPNSACGRLIATAREDVMGRGRMMSAPWDGIDFQAQTICDCGASYVRVVEGIKQLHTREGWR